MDQAIKMLQKHPSKVMNYLLADGAARRCIVKKVSNMIKKKKIPAELILASAKSSKKVPPKSAYVVGTPM